MKASDNITDSSNIRRTGQYIYITIYIHVYIYIYIFMTRGFCVAVPCKDTVGDAMLHDADFYYTANHAPESGAGLCVSKRTCLTQCRATVSDSRRLSQ